MGQKQSTLYKEPWRKIGSSTFERAEEELKRAIRDHKDTRLNIVVVGHTGAGKSTLINSIFSIYKGRIVDKVTEKAVYLPGCGTNIFTEITDPEHDSLKNIHFYDTMGVAYTSEKDSIGIRIEDLRAALEGRVPVGHDFRNDNPEELAKQNKADNVIIVVSAEVLEMLDDEETDRVYKMNTMQEKLETLQKNIPEDISRIVVITKIDCVCDETGKDVKNIYSSKKVHDLVKKVKFVFGVEEKYVFPVVNFVSEIEVDKSKIVPILFALRAAVNFAWDRK